MIPLETLSQPYKIVCEYRYKTETSLGSKQSEISFDRGEGVNLFQKCNKSHCAQKMKFSMKDCFSKYDLQIYSHLLKKSSWIQLSSAHDLLY